MLGQATGGAVWTRVLGKGMQSVRLETSGKRRVQHVFVAVEVRGRDRHGKLPLFSVDPSDPSVTWEVFGGNIRILHSKP